MENISSFGLMAVLTSSRTFPVGLPITKFADDNDSIRVPEFKLGDGKMDLNGNLIRSKNAQPVPLSMALIPDSAEDQALAMLLNANRIAKTNPPVDDSITLVVHWPNSSIVTYTKGIIVGGPASLSGTGAGRLSSNVYTFEFEDLYVANLATGARALSNYLAGFLR